MRAYVPPGDRRHLNIWANHIPQYPNTAVAPTRPVATSASTYTLCADQADPRSRPIAGATLPKPWPNSGRSANAFEACHPDVDAEGFATTEPQEAGPCNEAGPEGNHGSDERRERSRQHQPRGCAAGPQCKDDDRCRQGQRCAARERCVQEEQLTSHERQ